MENIVLYIYIYILILNLLLISLEIEGIYFEMAAHQLVQWKMMNSSLHIYVQAR